MLRRFFGTLLHLQATSAALATADLNDGASNRTDHIQPDSQARTIVFRSQPVNACHPAAAFINRMNRDSRNQR